MRIAKRGMLVSLLLLMPAATVAQPSGGPRAKIEKPDEKAYRADIARWLAGDKSVDITDLRQRHALIFGGYAANSANDIKAANDAAGNKDWAKALEIGKRAIDSDPLDFRGHIVAEVAYRELKQNEAYETERALATAILRSITNGGRSGTSAQESWTAMSVAEEYNVLGLLNYRVTGQSLNTSDGHSFDVMSVTDRNGKAAQIWFGIDWFFGRF